EADILSLRRARRATRLAVDAGRNDAVEEAVDVPVVARTHRVPGLLGLWHPIALRPDPFGGQRSVGHGPFSRKDSPLDAAPSSRFLRAITSRRLRRNPVRARCDTPSAAPAPGRRAPNGSREAAPCAAIRA